MTRFDPREDRAVAAVAGLTAVALLARLFALGGRVAHFDEARVAYWALRYYETGAVEYRFIVHGPLVQYADRVAFALLGVTDFSMRLFVALVGGLLPLAALLFREHLDDAEVGALAFFLALNPVLLYFSRFYRSTVPAAALSFVAFGLLVRAYDTRRDGYVLGAALCWALAFAAKESAPVYLLTWAGATALVLDHRLFRPNDDRTGVDWVRDRVEAWDERHDDPLGELLEYLGVAAASLVLAFVVILFFYAPRAPGTGAGFWSALASPGRLPGLVDRTLAAIAEGRSYWSGHSLPGKLLRGQITGPQFWRVLVERAELFVTTTLRFALVLCSLSVIGFLAERWGRERPRALVMFAGYWGFVSVVGYGLGADITSTWVFVNAFVPLAIPAAVVGGWLVRTGYDAYEDDDRVSVATAGLIAVLLVGYVGAGAATGVYANPTSPDNPMVQYAQPSQEMRAPMSDLRAIADEHEGTDVLAYGARFVDGAATAPRKPACVKWFPTLPFSWYFQSTGASVQCVNSTAPLPEELPPVVVTRADCTLASAVDCRTRPAAIEAPERISERVPDSYERHAFLIRTTAKPVVVYVDGDAG